MKSLSIFFALLLPFCLSAQSLVPSNSVKDIFKDIPMGVSLTDFKSIRPNAVVSSSEGFRTIVEEKKPKKGIELITYYFDNDGSQPFYEVIIDFENVAARDKAAMQLFGKSNHPNTQLENHWMIFNGDGGYPTVGWVYNISLIFAGEVPHTEWFGDDMFRFPADAPQVDLRINKNDVLVASTEGDNDLPKKTTDGLHTCEDYAQKITQLFESGMKISMPSDSINAIFPDAQKLTVGDDKRDLYDLQVNDGGMKNVTFMFDIDDKKQLFEAVFEFEDADSTLHLAELMFGKPTHPTLDNHWILGIGEVQANGYPAVSLAWVYENKLVVAANLPNTDIENDEDFRFTEEFVEEWRKRGMVDISPDDNKSEEEEITHQMNTLISEAENGFESLKGDALPDKNEEYLAADSYLGTQDCIIRKNSSGNWRFEARFPALSNIEEAKESFENRLNTLLNLEGLQYRLVKKSDITTKNGRTYLCEIQTLDDKSLGIILKLQIYPTSNQEYGIKLELGK